MPALFFLLVVHFFTHNVTCNNIHRRTTIRYPLPQIAMWCHCTEVRMWYFV